MSHPVMIVIVSIIGYISKNGEKLTELKNKLETESFISSMLKRLESANENFMLKIKIKKLNESFGGKKLIQRLAG